MKLVSRAAWGARSRTIPTNITPGRGGVTIHYVGDAVNITSHSQCDDRVRSIQNQHINSNGWADIAYSLLVCPHGYNFVGRGINRRTAANGTNSGNQNYYAICALIGGSQKPTAAMVKGIKDGVAYLRKSGGAGKKINGHRDHLSTSCPGSPLYAMVKAGTFGSGGSSGGGTTTPPKPGTKAPAWPGRLLSYPPLRKSSEARTWQARMKARGWSMDVDGWYGPGSAAVCRQFQAEKGLGVDGVVGPATWKATWESSIT